MVNPQIDKAIQEFEKALDHLKAEFSKLQIGRANPAFLDSINVDSYGTMMQLKGLANVSVVDASTLNVQPWDKSQLQNIEKALQEANLNVGISNTGELVRITLPPMTEERRREMVKIVHKLAEDARITIRRARQTAHDKFKSMKNDNEISEDEAKGAENRLQEKVDDYNKKVEEVSKAKEESIMNI